MLGSLASAVVALQAASVVYAQTVSNGNTQCGPGKLCPKSSPCCSRGCSSLRCYQALADFYVSTEYGQCGVGAYCLGGCDPLSSNTLDSCAPAPVCKSQDYQFTSLDELTSNTEYLGDASKAQWVYSGTPKIYNDQVVLTLSEDGDSQSGTLLASTSYVWYGKVTANLTSSRGAGVVSAFILLSDVKDEIDFEFIGADLTNAQSNFYFQGITDCKLVFCLL